MQTPHINKMYAISPLGVANISWTFCETIINEGKVIIVCTICHSHALMKIIAEALPTLIPLERIQNNV